MDSLNIAFIGKNELELRKEPVGDPGPGQLLVQTHKSLISTGTEAICFTRKFAEGTHYDQWVRYPFYPGYSNAGQVIAVGPDVSDFAPGDLVATRAGHRQYHLAGAGSVRRIPEGVLEEDATWFGLANIVQNGVRRSEHVLGDTVVVIGAGILGQLTIQYVHLLGAREIIVIDTAPKRLEMARAHGATVTLEMPVEDARAKIGELTGGRLADVVYDVTGHAPVFSHALRLTRRFGTVMLLGDTGTPGEQRLTPDVVARGLRIIGAHDGNPPPVSSDHAYWSHAKMTELFFNYLQRGRMRVSDLVTHRFSLLQAAEAYHKLATDRADAMGVVFDYTDLSG